MVKVLLVGAGNMGTAIIKRHLLKGGQAVSISIVDPHTSEETKAALTDCQFYSSVAALERSGKFDLIVLAIKPQVFQEISQEIAPLLADGGGVISIMAGIGSKRISEYLAPGTKVVRCMPNLAAAVGMSVNVAHTREPADSKIRMQFEYLFSGSGPVKWVEDEDEIHVATAISGSGPAYFFAFVEALSAAAEKAGLQQEFALDLAIDTLLGAAALLEKDRAPSKLRERVTSKGGTTESALREFARDRTLVTIVEDAVNAAHARSRELS